MAKMPTCPVGDVGSIPTQDDFLTQDESGARLASKSSVVSSILTGVVNKDKIMKVPVDMLGIPYKLGDRVARSVGHGYQNRGHRLVIQTVTKINGHVVNLDNGRGLHHPERCLILTM